jgi:hypothetical protein
MSTLPPRLSCWPLLVALAFSVSAPAQDDPKEKPRGPSPEQIEAALEHIKQGFEAKEVALRLDASEQALKTPCKQVAEALGKYGLRDKEVHVRQAVIDGLGHMPEPAALEVLLGHGARAKRDLEKDPTTHALLIRSIGRHGAEKSIPYLTKDLFSAKDRQVVQARILSLGRVRSVKAVEALIAMSRKAGGRRGNSRHEADLRLALCVLTGVDNGKRSAGWNVWWNDNKKTLEISKEPADLPRSLSRQWERYWADPKEKKGDEEGGEPKDGTRKGKSQKGRRGDG